VEQERQVFSAYSGATERICVIGGEGKMGRWFVEFFNNQGHQVEVFDVIAPVDHPGRPRTLERAVDGTSFAIIATPLETVPEAIDRLSAVRYGGVVFDIAS